MTPDEPILLSIKEQMGSQLIWVKYGIAGIKINGVPLSKIIDEARGQHDARQAPGNAPKELT